MAASRDIKPTASLLRKVADPEVDVASPQAQHIHGDTHPPIRKLSSLAPRHRHLCSWLCGFLNLNTSPLRRSQSHAQQLSATAPRALPAVVARSMLVAILAACVVATGVFLSVAARDPRRNAPQASGIKLRGGDARMLAQGIDPLEDSDYSDAETASESGFRPIQWSFPRWNGFWTPANKVPGQLGQTAENLETEGQNKRVALLFFGLPRSLQYTMPSIEKQLLRPLRDTGYRPTVFLHTFGGAGVPNTAAQQWKILKPFDHIVTPQKEFLDRRRNDIDACLDKGTGWINWPQANQTRNTENMVCQLKSIEEVGNLWATHYKKHKDEYAAVAFVRPDVQYDSALPTQVIPQLGESDVFVPGWGENKGMNDRFALMRPSVALQWTGRLKHALRQCLKEPIHSETFASRFAAALNLTVRKLPCDFVFFRVRASGKIAGQDEALPGFARAQRNLNKHKEALLAKSNNRPAKPPKPKPAPKPAPKSSSEKPSKSTKTTPKDKKEEKKPAKKVTKPSEKDSGEGGAKGGDVGPQRGVHPSSPAWNNSLAICALMKDEQLPDILEWLGYHRWLGVDKIYLRENGDKVTPKIAKALQPMVEEGWLELGAWEGQSPAAQQLWYNRCSQPDLAGSMSWILFTDLDEYLVLMDTGKAVEQPKLKQFLYERRGVAGLTLQWVMFGSSGHRDRPAPGGPLNHFSKCSNKLSFEMKCLAATHHLCDVPFIKPTYLHACAYQYDKSDLPALWPPVLYGDGSRAEDSKIVPMHAPPEKGPDNRTADQRKAKCRSYAGHLKGKSYSSKTQAIPQGPSLVLFHYMTRSFEDFADRKLSRYAGMYVDDFRERREAAAAQSGRTPTDEELFDELEDKLGINKAAAVCESAIKAGYTSQCCSE